MLKIGDRVIVVTDRWDNSEFIQSGKTGTVRTVSYYYAQQYSVTLDFNDIDCIYQKGDIEPYVDPWPEPDFDLEEIELGKDIIRQMD